VDKAVLHHLADDFVRRETPTHWLDIKLLRELLIGNAGQTLTPCFDAERFGLLFLVGALKVLL
jgi:hypothetical protein